MAFYDRLMLVKKCERVSGFTLTSHTNVLLVRQGLVTAGNGVLLTYRSLKSSKKGLYRGEMAERGGRAEPALTAGSIPTSAFHLHLEYFPLNC